MLNFGVRLLLGAVFLASLAPLPAQRSFSGTAEIEQSLHKLNELGTVLHIAAHPDDERTAVLAYFARGRHMRTAYLSLTRGEGGQNLIGSEQGAQLGIIRTQELLAARQIDGAEQFFTRAIDFGFTRTADETLKKWGHDRILSDVVWVVRRYRPDVILLGFSGTPRDGHGQHQVSGEVAQEVFKAAGDATVFPDQVKPGSEGGLGLTAWQPSAVYSMVPFAPVTEKGMFDYATGKWAPAKFHNYVTGEWINGVVPSGDVTIPVGTLDHDLGPRPHQGRCCLSSQRHPPLSGPDLASNGDTHGRTVVARHPFGPLAPAR